MGDKIRPNSSIDELQYTKQTLQKYHPYKLILIFSLLGITTMFLGLTFAYIYSKGPGWGEVTLPASFVYSTFILILSSVSIYLANHAFSRDWNNVYKISLFATLLLSFAFVATQYIGWQEMRINGIELGTHAAGSYIYLISGLHAIHVLAGVAFLSLIAFGALREVNHPAVALVYFTDPVKKLRLQLLSIYWHFIGAVWIYLFLFFAMNGL